MDGDIRPCNQEGSGKMVKTAREVRCSEIPPRFPQYAASPLGTIVAVEVCKYDPSRQRR